MLYSRWPFMPPLFSQRLITQLVSLKDNFEDYSRKNREIILEVYFFQKCFSKIDYLVGLWNKNKIIFSLYFKN